MFTGTVTDPADRSIMNVCFVMTPEYKHLEADFIDFCAERGIVGIKGHRSVGGFPRQRCRSALSVRRLWQQLHAARRQKCIFQEAPVCVRLR